MRVCITIEQRYDRSPDGAVWTDASHAYSEFAGYLNVFDSVRVLARVRDVAAPPAHALRANGPGVSIWPLPYYLGFGEFLSRWRSVKRAAISGIEGEQAIILRIPSIISSLLEPTLRRQGRPFAVRLVGDPHEAYSAGAIRHPLQPVFRACLTRWTAAQCRHASAVSYVTSNRLQARYPAAPGAFQSAVSDVLLPPGFIADRPRRAASFKPLRLITVGSLEQPYKGTDVLLEALARSIKAGLDAQLVVIGGGRYLPEFESLASRLGIRNRVNFKGALPGGERILSELDHCDLFVLPSRTEGLPRALIEAMARALPCIGSNVGGIPELLDEDCLFPAGDAKALAEKIIEVGSSPERMNHLSNKSLDKARQFGDAQLIGRRNEFLLAVLQSAQNSHGSLTCVESRIA
jgi:phosphatidyl-myo-inositol dimannoside synthase